MPGITDNVSFDTVAREWRMKWTEDEEKLSLTQAQELLDTLTSDIQKIDGVQSIQRVVCGGCHDFKVVIALPADKFGAWEEGKFAPEEQFLDAAKKVTGLSDIETQTYTLMPAWEAPSAPPKPAATQLTDNVSFDTVAREWRFKWSEDEEKLSLTQAQELLDTLIGDVQKVDGVQSVQRVVCGGCHDFKVVVSVAADKFGAWESAKFAPEEQFLDAAGKISGLSQIETQTYTIASVPTTAAASAPTYGSYPPYLGGVFTLEVGTDLFGVKHNTKLEFSTVPQLSELIIAAEGHFDKETRLHRPSGVPDAAFKCQSCQVYDDVLLRWVDLYSSSQLHPGGAVWLFQPPSAHHSDEPGDIPEAKFAPESWLGSPARARAVAEAGIRDPIMSEKLRSVFCQFDPDHRRYIPYTSLREHFLRYDLPWTQAYIGDYYSRTGNMSYDAWVGFASAYPHIVDSLYYRTRGVYADYGALPYYSSSSASAALAEASARRTHREAELRAYHTAYVETKARLEADYRARAAESAAAAASAAANAAATRYYYSPFSPRYL